MNPAVLPVRSRGYRAPGVWVSQMRHDHPEAERRDAQQATASLADRVRQFRGGLAVLLNSAAI